MATTTELTTTTTETPELTAADKTREYLDNYNTNREQKIRDMYAGQQNSTLAGLKSAYDQNMSTMERARDEIAPQYQQARNELAAQYERQRRNNNMQAAANGLNTGAGSQMQLGQMNAYQNQQGSLQKAENQALDKANQNIVDLKTNYENQIAQAAANNDYQKAAALLDEYGAQYDRTIKQADQLAQFGDFSMYTNIYGEDAAKQMEKAWGLQHPDLAYNLGKITADDYFKMTGRYPRGVSGYGGYSSGGGGYSASRDMAYRGPAGHYENGVWTLNSASSGSGSTNSSPAMSNVDSYTAFKALQADRL